jgi:hypothetical protein
MNLRDATLMFRTESAAHPTVAVIAQSAYDQLAQGEDVDHHVLSELLGEASGKGVLRAMRQKYSPAEYEAIIMPICAEVGRQAPIRSSRAAWHPVPGEDPLG